MTVEQFESLAKVLGIPGLVIAVWYLLERARIASGGESEKAKAAAEHAKATAMAEGFRSLSAQISAHQTADLESHADMATALARIEKGQDLAQADARADRHASERQPTTGLRVLRPTNGETP